MPDPAADSASLQRTSAAYQLFMLVLCVTAIVILLLETMFRLDPRVTTILQGADAAVCAVFFFDFCLSFARAPRKLRYLLTWGWLDLLSSIPALDLARWGRLARIARLTRVLRALRASRRLSSILFRQRRQSAVFAAALLGFLLIVGCSAAILQFETFENSNITTPNDAVWWAFATITTVGYGDRYPVSGEGRFIAAILMTAGVGLFGAFSAALAAWFLAPEEEATDEELIAIRAELVALRALIEERFAEPRVQRGDERGVGTA